jgi:hypothetical protein
VTPPNSDAHGPPQTAITANTIALDGLPHQAANENRSGMDATLNVVADFEQDLGSIDDIPQDDSSSVDGA